MKPASLRIAAAGVVLVAAGGAWWILTRPPAPPRNVLMLTIDTLRTDRVGAFGSKRGVTPTLDALAAEGCVFTHAYSLVPLTAPSHASMLTGRYPLANGLRNNGTDVLAAEEILLPEILKERGFRTAAIVSAIVLASDYGLDQGFDLYYEEGIAGTEQGSGLWYDQRPADQTVDRAIAWLRAESDRPFFLWVHLFDPHHPYTPPPPYDVTYAETPYDGEVAFADAQAGRLIEELRALGHDDDTLVVMSADHGESLNEHKEPAHGTFLYETTMHVPMILRLPGGARGGRRVADLASPMDIAPTVLDALGIPAPAAMQGVSLYGAAARGERVPARALYLESVHASSAYGWATSRALVRPAWKLIDLPDPELYDLAADPHEQTNLHAARPEQADEMRAEYDALLAELESAKRIAETASIDDETRDRLASLGYIAGAPSAGLSHDGPDPKRMAFMLEPMRIATNMVDDGEYADAVTIFRKVLEVDPRNRFALIQIGKALAGQGKVDEASAMYESALQAYPEVEEFYRNYGQVLLKARRITDAGAVFRRGAETIPLSGHLHFLYGFTLFLDRNWAPASEELKLACDLSPRIGRPHYLLAICLQHLGDVPGALAAIEAYLQRDPDVESLFHDPEMEAIRARPEFQEIVKRYL